jgi:hypothetical protein
MRTALLAEQERLENELARVRRMLAAYDADSGHQGLFGGDTFAAEIRAAISTIPAGVTFTGRDVFRALDRSNLEYTNVRAHINGVLLRSVERGILKKLKARGEFKRIP